MIDFNQIKLNREEKEAIKSNILSVVRVAVPPRHIFVLRPMMIGFSLLVFLAISFGIGAAAEKTLPGDLLYPVKIGINEKMRSVLAFSEESKAEVETELSEQRLSEAETLASRNKLDEKTRAKIEENFTKHADKARSRIENLQKKRQNENCHEAKIEV